MKIQTKRDIALLLVGAGVIGISLYAIMTSAYRKSKTTNRPKSSGHLQRGSNNSSSRNNSTFFRSAEYKQAVVKLSHVITFERKMGDLSAGSLLSVNRLVAELVKGEFLVKYKRSRENRRESLSDLQEYFQKYSKGVYECEDLLESGLIQVLNDVELEVEFYEEQYQKMCRQNPNFATMINVNHERMKTDLSENKKNIPVDKVIEMFTYQLEISEQHNFSGIPEIPFEFLVVLSQSYIGDKASVKFGIEEEDLILNEEILKDSRIAQLQKVIQAKLNYEQQKYITFPY